MMSSFTDIAFIKAARSGDLETLRKHIEYYKENGINIDDIRDNYQKSTALHNAALCSTAETMYLLLDAGASVHSRDTMGFTTFHYTIWSKKVENVAAILIEREDGFDVNRRLVHYTTPLIFASTNGFVEAVRMLLQKGADVNAIDYINGSALHVAACDVKSLKLVQVLLENGFNKDTRNKEGYNAEQRARVLECHETADFIRDYEPTPIEMG